MIIIPTSEHNSLSRSTYITFRCLLQNNYINLNKKQWLRILEPCTVQHFAFKSYHFFSVRFSRFSSSPFELFSQSEIVLNLKQ